MSPQRFDIEARIKTLNTVLVEKRDRQHLDDALRAADGDMPAALASLKGKLGGVALKKLAFVHSIAVWSDDHPSVVRAIAGKSNIESLRDVALHFDVKELSTLIDADELPESITSATAQEKKTNFAISLQNRLFAAEPTAVLQRMVQDAELPIADAKHRAGVVRFLSNQPEFNIRTTSVYTALKHPDALKGVAEEHRAEVVEHLKTLQRVQAISPVPAAVPVLMNANLTSAFRVAELPETTFMSAHGPALGEEAARQVYTNAVNAHVRNEQALMTIRDVTRAAGPAIVYGQEPQQARMAKLQAIADDKAVPLNLETLFGSIDYCECDECLSVYSPAAYFVDTLQYLRNNDLGPDPKDPKKPSPGIRKDPRDISNTPLEKLFRRRPDLGCLELTCENTFTVLPYIDLVNEVMESFVVHLDKYERDPNQPKQAILEVFNVDDETTSELLAQPQHVNYQAYCILKDAVYPFTLPYHQPIDAARIWLKYLGTSRYDVLNTFRTARENVSGVALTPVELEKLRALHAQVLDRSAHAEFLGITQEEHIILTREAFWPKAYFDLTLRKVHTEDDYEKQIGVKPVHAYYGYETEAELTSTDETLKLGATFVKKQFLPRTGIDYLTLVELLKTRFINPAFPQGRALAILESIRFSYRFLQTLVDTSSSEPRVRLGKLIEFLNSTQSTLPRVEALLHPDPCHAHLPEHCLPRTDFEAWVHCYFERIGKLIVLEAGEGPQLPIEGQLFTAGSPEALLGTLRRDGTAVDKNGKRIGTVDATGQLVGTDGKPLLESLGLNVLQIKNEKLEIVGFIVAKGLRGPHEETLPWLPARDTCDLAKVRLIHLDGTALSVDEYDRMQRFIRLWRKLGWTIPETDLALVRTSSFPGEAGAPRAVTPELETGGGVGFDMFQPDCRDTGDGNQGCDDDTPHHHDEDDCPELPEATENISVELLSQLVALRKLLDLTGLPLDKLLTFWAPINTAGEKSLYARLFLTHNLLGIDKVFKSDRNGNYLTEEGKLSDHLPVVMAALKMKSDDVAAIVELRKLPDVLSLDSVSTLYRHSLLRKALHVATADLPDLLALLGDPFKSPKDALAFLRDWGRMEDAGFTFRQLSYLIRDKDDPARPLAPAPKTILQISKTLYDGLNAIDRDHRDVPTDKREEANADLVRAKAGLLYEASLVEQVLGLLEGTSVYTTNAPPNQVIAIPDTDSLAKKLKYTTVKGAIPPSASVQVTGTLTDAEKVRAKALSGDPGWGKAIDRLGKQALQFFNDNLAGIFPDTKQAVSTLLAGDVNVAPDPSNPTSADANTAPGKRYYFLQFFLPFLRQRLAHRLIVTQLSGAAGLTAEVTDVLLSDVLVVGASKEPAILALERIHQKPAAAGSDWAGYLVPSFDDAYTFIARSLVGETAPPPLVIDGLSIPFTVQQEDPSNVWSTDPASPTPLKGGHLYLLQVTGQPAPGLQWKTSSSPKAFIPEAALLPDYSSSGTSNVFIELYKAALLVNGFDLTPAEVSYWQTHGSDFAADGTPFDFNSVGLGHWRRLQAYASLRDRLPKTESSLLDLFLWADKPKNPAKLSEKIAATTLWKQASVQALLAPDHFDLDDPKAFRSEKNLLKLLQAVEISDKVGTDVARLFAWANPVSRFSVCHRIADGIRATLRARYDQNDWEQVVKPLNDQLRENQKQALIDYLLVQQPLINWGVTDADGLFEFFLIDVQMGGCMKTSRIKQAISTVQLFVQRCLLGEEDRVQGGVQIGVRSDVLDRDRWKWMGRFRVWEANRKVFLYPENWVKSALRDDKSSPFKDLESELLQKDINPQTVEEALKNYAFKVDEIANLKVVGLFVEQEVDESGKPAPVKIHFFGKTRTAPYLFYYRYYHVAEQNWYPWERVQPDIPSYDVEQNEQIVDHGSYVIPVVWEKRLLVFFPQITPARTAADPPVPVWAIKMGWSERRNGKWTPKQISSEAIYTTTKFEISKLRFIPRAQNGGAPLGVISVYRGNGDDFTGAFWFSGSQVTKGEKQGPAPSTPASGADNSLFHYYQPTQQFHSLQTVEKGPADFGAKEPFVVDHGTANERNVTLHSDGTERQFGHPFAHRLLSEFATGGLDGVFDFYLNRVPLDSVNTTKADALADAFGSAAEPIGFHELKRPYSLYNWEAAFHAPMLLAERLLDARQFEHALAVYHYVLDPHATGTDGKRFWRFFPFTKIDAADTLEKLFLGLKPNAPDATGRIDEWRNRPFQPHVIARSRPSAYMKWVAMKYIEALIAYGDYYFRQNTLETIPLAIQCYVLASHVYGPRAQTIPKRGHTLPQTYNGLLDKWDAFSNAMVELELVFPFSNQTPLPVGASNGVVGLANVFGFASSLYFCIPDNPQLRALRDTIDDRLFKIRHCQDIDGVVRDLPLFEPPIDPALLVQAAAAGLDLSSVLSDLNSPMPNYRFGYLLQKASQLCAELKALGNSFLAAKKDCDGEALGALRARHESSIHNLMMEVKTLQVDEASKALEALQQSRKGPAYRLQHHLKLLGEDLSQVPKENADFGELTEQIENPIDDSGLKLSKFEKEEMDKASEANDRQEDVGRTETLASIFHAVPNVTFTFGVVGTAFGGSNVGSATQAVARANQVVVGNRSFSSTNAGRKASLLRQLQDRVQQANIAGHEVKSIDKQALTQQIRIDIAQREITNQQKQIDNAQEVEEFLRNKYTNEQLYAWMTSQISGLYHQAYNLAYDMARRAERLFQFERGLTTSNFIQYGYWDTAYDGLFSGEHLSAGLVQLEAAYLEKRGHDYEISKVISLREIDPLALLQLKETGSCEFALPEVLFDMDYPGHYQRRIKSVSLQIPCVLGPHTSLNSTLRLVEHKYRFDPIAKGKSDYPEQAGDDERFRTVNVPITSIAVSSLADESGVFELNFHDERYLPFEGAGAISKWKLDLPAKFRQFDYATITDVVLRVRYTSLGSDKLKAAAAGTVEDYVKSVEDLSRSEGLFAIFDLKNDFPNEWHDANHPIAGATERVLTIRKLNEKLPLFTKGRAAKKIVAKDVYLFVSDSLSENVLTGKQGDSDLSLRPGKATGSLKSMVASDLDVPMGDFEIKIKDTKTVIDKMFLVARYVLT